MKIRSIADVEKMKEEHIKRVQNGKKQHIVFIP
jgi:hypothetical protein